MTSSSHAAPLVTSGWRRLAGPAIILLAAAIATAPTWYRGSSCGHDFDFHLVSWLDALHGWKQGLLYPHWTSSPNFGAGEPRFVFYPPLTWMLGAALGLITPWNVVPAAMIILLLTASGLATRALARQALPEGPATLAGCVAIFSGYSLYTTYERSAFAELTGGFWIPLILLLLLRERPEASTGRGHRWARALDGSTLLLALVVAGAWLSNAPVGVMTSYLLAAFALAVALLSSSWIPMIRAAIGASLGLGLAAFYIVPAAWEQRWVAIRQATDDPGLLIENSWLFAHHASSQLAEHDVELTKVSFIAVIMVGLALGGALICWIRRGFPGERRWWIPMAIIPLAVLLLQFPASLPVWNVLPKLRFLQFPWRWLVAVEAPMGIFFASAIWARGRLPRIVVPAVCGMFFLASTAVAGTLFFQTCDSGDSVKGMLDAYRAGTGFEGTDEYAPPAADDSLVATGLPAACLVNDARVELGEGDSDVTPLWSASQGICAATFEFSESTEEHLRINAVSPRAGYMILRLRTYPAWELRVNGRAAAATPVRPDGLMVVAVPEGPFNLTADWETTGDVRLGRWISLAALALITSLGLMARHASPPRLS